jgi:hypothetical protein
VETAADTEAYGLRRREPTAPRHRSPDVEQMKFVNALSRFAELADNVKRESTATTLAIQRLRDRAGSRSSRATRMSAAEWEAGCLRRADRRHA